MNDDDDVTGDLFDSDIDYSKRARRDDPQTSHDAAESIEPFAHKHHGVILAALRRIGEGTFEEIARAADLTPSQTWKRLSELEEKLHCIVKTGRTRPGSSRRQCTIWQPVRPGPEPVPAAQNNGGPEGPPKSHDDAAESYRRLPLAAATAAR